MPISVKSNKKEEEQTPKIPLISSDFATLTSIDDIRECLRLLDEEETRIDSSLDAMLSQESQLTNSLNELKILK